MREKYKLLKDLPDLKAGSVFYFSEEHNGYICAKTGAWLGGHRHHVFTAGTVSQTPEWFEKIESPKLLLSRTQLSNLVTQVVSETTRKNHFVADMEAAIDRFVTALPRESFRGDRGFGDGDMLDFAKFVIQYPYIEGRAWAGVIPIDMLLLDKWIQKAHPEDCVTKPKES